MTYRTPLLISLISASMLFTGAAFAQQSTMPPAATTPMTGAPSGNSSSTYSTAKGPLTVNSGMPQTPSTTSPPSFEQLANGHKVITKDAASAYPPLANDFEYAAHGGNSITKSQYEHWLQNLN
jgi:hypothetical protein